MIWTQNGIHHSFRCDFSAGRAKIVHVAMTERENRTVRGTQSATFHSLLRFHFRYQPMLSPEFLHRADQWSPNNLISATLFVLSANRKATGIVCLFYWHLSEGRQFVTKNFLRKRRKQKQCTKNKLDLDECLLCLINKLDMFVRQVDKSYAVLQNDMKMKVIGAHRRRLNPFEWCWNGVYEPLISP